LWCLAVWGAAVSAARTELAAGKSAVMAMAQAIVLKMVRNFDRTEMRIVPFFLLYLEKRIWKGFTDALS
jgi:hypothetical protein